ncbi:hypothetical protein [Limnospira sp. Paracas R14]|uniref:IS66 family transposase n=1 Tax=Limnospira sp. Paracas R14 TaxID=2981108 RepID=UPI0028E1133A|nr:hypothetical protein [Limnospira sp. Paracas R14]
MTLRKSSEKGVICQHQKVRKPLFLLRFNDAQPLVVLYICSIKKPQLSEQVTIAKSKLESLEKSAERVLILERQIQALTKALYGRSSERRQFIDPNQTSLFDVEEQEKGEGEETEQVAYTRRKPE